MRRRQRALLATGIAQFLAHVAKEGIISNAQLLQAKHALLVWEPSVEGTDEDEARPPRQLATPAAREAKRARTWHEDDNKQQELEQEHFQRAAKRLRGIFHAILVPRQLSQLQQTQNDGVERLSLLPLNVLDHAMALLAAQEGGSSVRGTCRWLRSAFDRCNSRLVLRGDEEQVPDSFQANVQQMLRNSPSVISLTLAPSLTSMTWSQVVEAGGPQLLQRLEKLVLRGRDDVEDLGALSACSKLQHLDLSLCKNLQDLGPLAACGALQQLELEDCQRIEDLAPLASCVGLQRLVLASCYKLEDIAPLASCVRLQHLDLVVCMSLQNLQPLTSCVALQDLRLSGCNVTDLGPLAACMELQHLQLYSCIYLEDLGPLASCVKLQRLNLRGCPKLQDLRPLASCSRLQTLTLSGCKVDSIAPLAECLALKSLDLEGCTGVKSIASLAACSGLRQLNLRGCLNVGSLRCLAALTRLRVSR